MTAKEARQLTKAALINTLIMQNLDKAIAKAAKEGKYSIETNFYDTNGWDQYLTKVERDAIVEHYSGLGFMVTSEVGKNNKYTTILIDWSSEIEETGGAIITENNVD